MNTVRDEDQTSCMIAAVTIAWKMCDLFSHVTASPNIQGYRGNEKATENTGKKREMKTSNHHNIYKLGRFLEKH